MERSLQPLTSEQLTSSNFKMTVMFKKMGQRAFECVAKTGKRPKSPAVGPTLNKIAATAEGLYKGQEDTSLAGLLIQNSLIAL
ncbi:hypothetical protein J6590_099540 [Homalodisca vitripennis]|nr:hypothetical protein J6590_099540 [Homalodisca vitripennis]